MVGDEAGDHSRVVINSERLGLAGNWNQCVALSGTPFVAIFHQDDVMRPGHLAAHLAAFQVDERIGLVDSASEVIDAEGQSVPEAVVERGGLGPIDRTFGPGQALPELARGNPIRCSAVTLRAAAHADVGGFDPSYRYVVDWDFWLRVARRWGVAWLARPSVAVRWHPASETHRFQAGTLDLEETRGCWRGCFPRRAERGPMPAGCAVRRTAASPGRIGIGPMMPTAPAIRAGLELSAAGRSRSGRGSWGEFSATHEWRPGWRPSPSRALQVHPRPCSFRRPGGAVLGPPRRQTSTDANTSAGPGPPRSTAARTCGSTSALFSSQSPSAPFTRRLICLICPSTAAPTIGGTSPDCSSSASRGTCRPNPTLLWTLA